MIEVFITDIHDEYSASKAIEEIRSAFPAYRITVDLEDSEKIMRVDSQNGPVASDNVIDILRCLDMQCSILEH